MTVFNFNDAERELLLGLMLEHLLARAESFAAKTDPLDNALLFQACAIIAELNDPAATLSDAMESRNFTIHGIEDARSDPFMRAAAENEGIDLDKELGPFDRRAAAPRCTHGKLFTDECAACNDRCPHGLEMTSPCAGCGRGVAVTPTSRECICWFDREELGNNAPLRTSHLADCPLSREGVTAHAPYCPVNRPGFQPVDGFMQCNCDFGPRLNAVFGGRPQGLKLP